MFKRRILLLFKGFNKINGSPSTICKKIVNQCYNGTFFQVSNYNYQAFYARDLGWCFDSLLSLGYKKELTSTLDWALSKYHKHKGIYVAITTKEIPFNFPDVYSPDSVAYLFRSLSKLKNSKLINKYRQFLEDEASKFFKVAIDPETGLIKKKHFSGMRDHTIRFSSCYDNVMAWVVQQACKEMNIPSKFEKYDYQSLLIEHFWNGSYFESDLEKKGIITGDANTLPFWLGLIKDKKKLKSVTQVLEKNGLCDPFPLKYVAKDQKESFVWYEYLVPNWQTKTIWAQLGLMYIDVLSNQDKMLAKNYLEQYKKAIAKYGTFLEIYTGKKPFKNLIYITDEGMLWASMYLHLEKKFNL